METKWLEDFVTLAQTKNFSKAATLRCVTQPAFSRRIQSLEAWLGCELVDRSSFPTRMTPQGEVFYEQALRMLEQVRQARTVMRGGVGQSKCQISVVMPHTLASTLMPSWIASIHEKAKEHASEWVWHLTASNVHDAILHFSDGGADFLLCYHHSSEPIELEPAKYEFKTLGIERLLPFAKATADGLPMFNLDVATTALPSSWLAYSRHAYLSRLVDLACAAGPAIPKRVVFETDMSESLKAACAAGLGVAWLPAGVVGKTPGLVPISGPWAVDMDIRLYRRTQKFREQKPVLDYLELVWQLWPSHY